MANLRSTTDIKKQTLHNVGELDDGSSPYDDKCLEYLNDAYKKVVSASSPYGIEIGEPWAWAKSPLPGVVILKAPYEDGTISLARASRAGVFSIAPALSLGSFAKRFLKVDGRPEYFRIKDHAAGSVNFTLDSEYTDETSVALAFKVIKLEYALGDSQNKIARLVDPLTVYRQAMSADDDGRIYGMDPSGLKLKFPFSRLRSGTPTHCATVHEADGIVTLRFSHYVIQDTRVEYDWIPQPADLTDSSNSIPLIPEEHRCVLEYIASYRLMLDKDDSRAQGYLDLAQATLKSMQAAKRKKDANQSNTRGCLIARPDLTGERSDYAFRR